VRVALTIDTEHADHPHPVDGCERILDVLAERRVRATFFVQGKWARAHPSTARRIGDEGHLVGSHSYHHVQASWMTPAGLRRDLIRARQTVEEHTGVDPFPWFRLPYGDGSDDKKVRSVLAAEGWRHVPWNVDPADWSPETTPVLLVERVVEEAVALRDEPAVVLTHSWPLVTGTALGDVIAALRHRNATFLTVDAL